MTHHSELYYRLGTFRSGGTIAIPDSLTKELAPMFVSAMGLDDQIDFFRVTEYMLLLHKRAGSEHREAKLNSLLNKEFRKRLQTHAEFQTALDTMGLKTSLDYVGLGSVLAII